MSPPPPLERLVRLLLRPEPCGLVVALVRGADGPAGALPVAEVDAAVVDALAAEGLVSVESGHVQLTHPAATRTLIDAAVRCTATRPDRATDLALTEACLRAFGRLRDSRRSERSVVSHPSRRLALALTLLAGASPAKSDVISHWEKQMGLSMGSCYRDLRALAELEFSVTGPVIGGQEAHAGRELIDAAWDLCRAITATSAQQLERRPDLADLLPDAGTSNDPAPRADLPPTPDA